MAVVIRLARGGRTHTPHYRVVAIDRRNHREGKAAEILGTYDPLLNEKNIQVDIERVHAWIEQGAQYSAAVASLLKRQGYELFTAEQLERKDKQAAKRKARRKARAKKDIRGFVKPSRRAVKNHAKKVKAERKVEQEKALEAHRAAQAAAAPAEDNAEG